MTSPTDHCGGDLRADFLHSLHLAHGRGFSTNIPYGMTSGPYPLMLTNLHVPNSDRGRPASLGVGRCDRGG